MGEMVRIRCDGCGASAGYGLGFGMMGSETQLACCRTCAQLVTVTRDALRDEPFTDACPDCDGVVERPYPSAWQRLEDGTEIARAACPKCGATLHLQYVGLWD
jgi:hypothetical protein